MFGKANKVEAAKAQAKKDYESIVALETVADEPRAPRVRLAMRAKTNIEMTFVEAARKTEAFEEQKMAALLAGTGTSELVEPELTDPFKLIKSEKGTVVSYLPIELGQQIFDIAGAYQRASIDAEQAVNAGQAVMDKVCHTLALNDAINVLEFLIDSEDDAD